MKVVCAWCQREGRHRVLAEREPLDDPTETHGMCPRHSEEMIAQLPSPSFPGVRLLIVVRRTEQALFDHLTESLTSLPEVAVLLDRRQRDRRQTPSVVATERRRTSRRIRTAPFSSLGFLIVRFGPTHQQAFGLPPVKKLRVV